MSVGGDFDCDLLLADRLGGREERAGVRGCLLAVSTDHHRGFLGHIVAGDPSLGKVV